jgi:hypothetical protein
MSQPKIGITLCRGKQKKIKTKKKIKMLNNDLGKNMRKIMKKNS